jgi:hypothetical protein
MKSKFQMIEESIPEIKSFQPVNQYDDFFKEEVLRFCSIAGTVRKSFKNVDTNIDERIISHILMRSVIENYFWLLYIFEDVSNATVRFEEYLNDFKVEYRKLYNDPGFNLKSKIYAPDPSWKGLKKAKDLNSILISMYNIHGDRLNFIYPFYRITSFDTHGKSLSALFRAAFNRECNFPFVKIDPIIELIADEYLITWKKIKK